MQCSSDPNTNAKAPDVCDFWVRRRPSSAVNKKFADQENLLKTVLFASDLFGAIDVSFHIRP
jgi:hypothetical protein